MEIWQDKHLYAALDTPKSKHTKIITYTLVILTFPKMQANTAFYNIISLNRSASFNATSRDKDAIQTSFHIEET